MSLVPTSSSTATTATTTTTKMLNVKLWPNWAKVGIFVAASLSIFSIGYTGAKYYCKRTGRCKIGGGGSPPPSLGEEIIIPLIGKRKQTLDTVSEETTMSISSNNVIELQ